MNTPTPQPGKTARQQRTSQANAWRADELERTRPNQEATQEPLVWCEFAVQAVHDNYLTCLQFDGITTYGAQVNVAKDPDLRKTSYHGLTIDGLEYSYTGAQARTVTKEGTSDSKDQVIIPRYQVPSDGPGGYNGSIITAAPILTRVKDDEDAVLFCQWREITQRAWANVEEGS